MMFSFQVYLKDLRITPKPARLTRQHPKAQSKQAQKYLENQERLRDEFWLAKLQIQEKGKHHFPLEGPLSLRLDYLLKGKPRIDRSNIEKAVEDALVKAGVIVDDCIRHVPDAHVSIWSDQDRYRLYVQLKYIPKTTPSKED